MHASFRSILFPVGGILMLALLLTGCISPRSRARERPAALRPLSREDREIALGGGIRDGFGKDAVYVAWGAPDRTETVRMHGQAYELWYYTRHDQGASGGAYAESRGSAFPAGKGDSWFHRAGSYGTTDSLYSTPDSLRGFPPPPTGMPYRRAVFARDKVVGYEPR